jgi:hypothetical protein
MFLMAERGCGEATGLMMAGNTQKRNESSISPSKQAVNLLSMVPEPQRMGQKNRFFKNKANKLLKTIDIG